MPIVENPKAVIKAMKEGPSIKHYHSGCMYGPETKEVLWYIRDHAEQLATDYPIDRAMWPTALHDAIGGMPRSPRLPKPWPWAEWVVAILGDPYPDFPTGWKWRAMIHQVWLIRCKEWRLKFEADFKKEFPEAIELDLFYRGKSDRYKWQIWQYAAYSRGFQAVGNYWRGTSIDELSDRRELAGASVLPSLV
jgi:hypothetical protein